MNQNYLSLIGSEGGFKKGLCEYVKRTWKILWIIIKGYYEIL